MTLYWLNRQLQMMWQQLVLSKFLYISGPAQPLESHRFSGEKTRLQTCTELEFIRTDVSSDLFR